MCGIAGVFGKKLDINQINNCQNILKNRGPDFTDYFQKEDITLIHTRLSILDLSSNGNQPMIDKETGTVLIFNGEIYNFKELQNKINNKVAAFNDTRVILNLFLKYGFDSFKMLRGMFAIAIWQPKEKKLILVRDRFGIKPLYYNNDNNNFYFASEIKALQVMGVNRNFEYKSIKNYLVNGILENNSETLFENIFPVEPGTIITIKKNNVTKKKFWNSKIITKNFIKKNEINEAIRDKLNEVIKLHLISDVKVGITLSSGIDSQILLKYILDQNKDISAYTYGYENKVYDESDFVKEKYKDLNIKKVNSILKPNDLISELNEAIKYFHSPLGGLGTLSFYNLMKTIISDNTKVILSGEGGDEVFFGYKYYYYAYLLDLKITNQIEKLNYELKKWKELTNEDLANDIFREKYLENKIYGSLAPDGTQLSSELIEGEFLRNIKLEDNSPIFQSNHLEAINQIDIKEKKLPKLLMFQDRCSMNSNVESRVPFLDHELYEMARNISADNHINNGNLKSILNTELNKKNKKNIEKKYVAAPQREWLKKDLYKSVKEIVFDGYLVNNKMINKDNFLNKYQKYSESNELGNSFFIWKVLNLEILFNQT